MSQWQFLKPKTACHSPQGEYQPGLGGCALSTTFAVPVKTSHPLQPNGWQYAATTSAHLHTHVALSTNLHTMPEDRTDRHGYSSESSVLQYNILSTFQMTQL